MADVLRDRSLAAPMIFWNAARFRDAWVHYDRHGTAAVASRLVVATLLLLLRVPAEKTFPPF